MLILGPPFIATDGMDSSRFSRIISGTGTDARQSDNEEGRPWK